MYADYLKWPQMSAGGCWDVGDPRDAGMRNARRTVTDNARGRYTGRGRNSPGAGSLASRSPDFQRRTAVNHALAIAICLFAMK